MKDSKGTTCSGFKRCREEPGIIKELLMNGIARLTVAIVQIDRVKPIIVNNNKVFVGLLLEDTWSIMRMA